MGQHLVFEGEKYKKSDLRSNSYKRGDRSNERVINNNYVPWR
jgi:hypothetical protein